MPQVTLHSAGRAGQPPLYHRYPGQYRPQSAFVELDLESGDLRASWNEDLGNAVPERVQQRLALRWSVPIYLTDAEVAALLEAIAPVAQRLLDGAEVIWGGSHYTVSLDGNATDAGEEIDAICAEAEGSMEISTPGEWLGNVPTAELLEEGETVVHAAMRIAAAAWATGTFLDGDLVAYLGERLAADCP